jgi:D-alanyl-D-alanine carboxypeptidase
MTNKKKIMRILRIIMPLIAVVSLIIFPPWKLVWAYIKPLPDTVQEQVEDAINMGFDGIIVYVDEKGKSPAFYSAGWKNTENKIPADPHSLFKIASIGKLYDALVISKLVGSGKLNLDSTLANYMPEVIGRIENADVITLRQLVQHRSGIPSFTNVPGFWVDPPENSQKTLEMIFDQPANFEPGQDYEYSNTNYLLLTEISEKVLEYSKFQYVREQILSPLGLKNTFGSIHEINMDDLMSGYYVGVDEDIKYADYSSMIATAEDVGIFLRALNDGTIFNGNEREIYSSIYKFSHTGLVPGYQSIARYYKDIDAVVIQFTNTTNFDGYNWTFSEIIYNRIIKILKEAV